MDNKRIRQYVGILSALISYYLVHEGAHLLTALCMGTFKTIHFMGLGIQIDVYREQMSDFQLGLFCLAGALATLVAAVVMLLCANRFCAMQSKMGKAVAYYVTIVFLLLDPLYLSVICGFVGGGDMNGIRLLMPELMARILFAILFVVNLFIFVKVVLPKYRKAFVAHE